MFLYCKELQLFNRHVSSNQIFIQIYRTVWYELLCGEWPFNEQPPEAIIWQVGKGIKQSLANLQASRDVKVFFSCILCWEQFSERFVGCCRKSWCCAGRSSRWTGPTLASCWTPWTSCQRSDWRAHPRTQCISPAPPSPSSKGLFPLPRAAWRQWAPSGARSDLPGSPGLALSPADDQTCCDSVFQISCGDE